MDGGARPLAATVLAVRGLTVQFGRGAERVTALQDVAFDLRQGETLALVGESGSGKSLTALSIMGLLPVGAAATAGQVLLADEDLLRKTREQLVQTRGRRVAMVFQEADDVAEPRADDRPPADGGAGVPSRRLRRMPRRGSSSCCASLASTRRSGCSDSIRTSFPAACDSG